LDLIVESDGTIRTIYSEQLDLATLGDVAIRRASHVEPEPAGGWTADLSPVGGPVLGPFPVRSAALAAEQRWLEVNWLLPDGSRKGSTDAV
jgi:hypothetical protein